MQWLMRPIKYVSASVVAFVGAWMIAGALFEKFFKGNPLFLALGALFVFAGVQAWPRRPTAPTPPVPTERQMNFAKRIGIVTPDGVTQDELFNLVCERLEQS